MNLLLIILSLVIFSFIPVIFPKLYKSFIVISILLVLSSYFFISKNFYFPNVFVPSEKIFCHNACFNYYNLLSYSIKNKKLYIGECDKQINYKTDFLYEFQSNIISRNGKQKISTTLLDTSIYKYKVYLYFGITPVLLFYLPFNLVTGMFLTDKFVGFILGSLIFLLSLLLIKMLTARFCIDCKNEKKICFSICLLSVFLLAFSSLIPFVLTRISIYEVAILMAMCLLIFSFIVLYLYLKHPSVKIFSLPIFDFSNILVFVLGFILSIAVGARPHYVLFIPVFFIAICVMNYYRSKNIKYVIKQAVMFLIPCIVIGIGLALYNYLRFESIFDFGFNYQVKPTTFTIEYSFKELIGNITNTLKQIFFKLPNIDKETIISLTESSGHKYGDTYITGIFWMCPIIIMLFFIPNFLKNIYKKDKILFTIAIVMVFVILINSMVTSLYGILMRYIVEYLLIMFILSIVLFRYYLDNSEDKLLKRFVYFVFIIIFVWSMFVNTALIFCKNNFKNNHDAVALEGICRKQTVKFLF